MHMHPPVIWTGEHELQRQAITCGVAPVLLLLRMRLHAKDAGGNMLQLGVEKFAIARQTHGCIGRWLLPFDTRRAVFDSMGMFAHGAMSMFHVHVRC